MSTLRTSTVRTDAITDEVSRLFDYPFDGTTSFTPPLMTVPEPGFGIGLIVGIR